MDKLIINVALTGCIHHKGDNPALPITPQEVAEDARRCADAGASMFHVHARNGHGNPCWGKGHYQTYVDAVRGAVPDCVIVASCSGRHFHSFFERSGAIHAKPDMATLTLGSYNVYEGANVNEPSMIEALAKEMQKHGVIPEMECFELGHVAYARRLIEKGLVSYPWYFNLFLGAPWAIPSKKEYLVAMIDLLPERAVWAGAGIGRHQFEVNKWAIALGGHVRVGLEDSLWMDTKHNDPATNVRQVERMVKYGRVMGREPGNAREILFSD